MMACNLTLIKNLVPLRRNIAYLSTTDAARKIDHNFENAFEKLQTASSSSFVVSSFEINGNLENSTTTKSFAIVKERNIIRRKFKLSSQPQRSAEP